MEITPDQAGYHKGSPKHNFCGLVARNFLQAESPSCHPTNSVGTPKGSNKWHSSIHITISATITLTVLYDINVIPMNIRPEACLS